MILVVHVDDMLILVRKADVENLRTSLEAEMDVKQIAILTASGDLAPYLGTNA